MPDARLDANGDLAIPTSWVRGPEAVAQRIRVRLSTWLGEWGLDVREGGAFERWSQAKPPPLAEIEAWVRRETETTKGVVGVDALSGSVSRSGEVSISVVARVYEDGEGASIVVGVGATIARSGAPPVWAVRAGLRAARVAT